MSRKLFKILIYIIFVCSFATSGFAQDGAEITYSPYSVFGIGDITRQGSAFNNGMGGVGIASRNKRFINYLNPAAVTARDTLSFMMDAGLASENKIYRQGDLKSANNALNLSDFVISFPIYRSLAFQMGLTPFSSVGYGYSTTSIDPSIIQDTGSITYSASGNGGLYQLFAGAGLKVFPGFSAGAEAIYYFGNIDKASAMTFGKASYRDLSSGYTLELSGLSGKFGVQYENKVGKDMTLTLGATYRLGTSLKGHVTDFSYASISGITDTLRHRVDTLARGNVKIASEAGVGISLRKGDKWSLEVDYLISDWGGSGMDTRAGFSNSGTSVFSAGKSQSVRAGFEIVPNRNDIRYYLRRCAYRMGTYYEQAYYRLDGNTVDSFGVTFGVTLPVFRWYNGLSLGVDLGKRGKTSGNMTRERYANFTVGINLHDIWFQKPRYD